MNIEITPDLWLQLDYLKPDTRLRIARMLNGMGDYSESEHCRLNRHLDCVRHESTCTCSCHLSAKDKEELARYRENKDSEPCPIVYAPKIY